jgi:hypothetical protein
MSDLVPARLRSMARDTRLSPRGLQIWLIVAPELLVSEFRPLVPADIAQAQQITRPVVTSALKELVACGYLDLGERSRPNGPLTYRLPVAFAPPTPVAPVPTGPVPPRGRRMYSQGVD